MKMKKSIIIGCIVIAGALIALTQIGGKENTPLGELEENASDTIIVLDSALNNTIIVLDSVSNDTVVK